jgi:hypothetical protein
MELESKLESKLEAKLESLLDSKFEQLKRSWLAVNKSSRGRHCTVAATMMLTYVLQCSLWQRIQYPDIRWPLFAIERRKSRRYSEF